MSLKSNSDSKATANGGEDCDTGNSDNWNSELVMVCELDLDFDDCYLLGLPKLSCNVFEEMKMLEELDLDLEDLLLFGGLPTVKDGYEDEVGSKDSDDKISEIKT